jgi:aryl-alcohol dehydrogenase-like predicted oxidoreductase
MGAPDDQTDFL